MPYTQTTLVSLTTQIGVLLDDVSERYWTLSEKQYAVWESLRVWGALTAYWRTRGTFRTVVNTPYYDLSAVLPALRPRAWTLQQVVQEIQYHLLEAPNGISGAGMSGQVSIGAILSAVQRARNRFVLDVHLPYSVSKPPLNIDTPDGLLQLPSSCMYLHRAGWQDLTSGTWTNLWRQDDWAIDHNAPLWTINPGAPLCYSESEAAPIQIQLDPPPQAVGNLEIITVDSLQIDLTSATSTFNIPDEWIHAVKYAALADLLSADSQLNDPMRAQYAQMRYSQAVDAAQMAKSLMRLTLNGVALQVDSFAALDAGRPTWRNQTGQPFVCGLLYDFLALADVPDNVYGVAADVVQAAPLPATGSEFIQIGYEDLPQLINYCLHTLLFKCGGTEFKNTFSGYDGFMKSVAGRGRITEAKIQYLGPVFNQPQKEQTERPDQMKAKA